MIRPHYTRAGKALPWYTQCWNWCKQFPAILATGASTPPQTSGVAAAAFISAAIGTMTVMVTHHLAETSIVREKFIYSLGYWIPGSTNPDPVTGNIGSYAGKETMLLIGWLISWFILHHLLEHRQVSPRTIFFGTFGLFVAAIVMCWHPLFPYLPLQ
jgi:hypothetical protein